MSLRGSKTTEAISPGIENKEIATLPLVARNDKKEITTHSLGRGRVRVKVDFGEETGSARWLLD